MVMIIPSFIFKALMTHKKPRPKVSVITGIYVPKSIFALLESVSVQANWSRHFGTNILRNVLPIMPVKLGPDFKWTNKYFKILKILIEN